MDFGKTCSQMDSNLGPCLLQKSIKNQGRFLIRFSRTDAKGLAVQAGLREDLIITELRQRHLKVRLTRPAVLRRIEHAARNTAAAPFCRRSSLE